MTPRTLLIVGALSVLVSQALAAQQDVWFDEGHVSAHGFAERAFRPRYGVVTLTLQDSATTPADAQRIMAARMRDLRARLVRAGVPADAIRPPTTPAEERFHSRPELYEVPGGYAMRLGTFVVRREAVSVHVRLGQYARQIDAAARRGGVVRIETSYESDWMTAEGASDAATAALRSARTAAEAAARGKGGRLGRLVSIERDVRAQQNDILLGVRRSAPRVRGFADVRARWAFVGPAGVTFARLDEWSFDVPLPGVAVVRDSATWATLLRRFGHAPYGRVYGELPDPPQVDFRREMLVLVGFGRRPGCIELQYIDHVLVRPDSVLVAVRGPDNNAEPTTSCYPSGNLVDIARVRRRDLPVAFVPATRGSRVPPPATWWWTPTPAEVARLGVKGLGPRVEALLRDPQTPLPVVRALVTADKEGVIVASAVNRADVADDRSLLFELARRRITQGQASWLLVHQHSKTLEPDPATPPNLLRLLITRLYELSPLERRSSAERLFANPRVRADSTLLGELVYRVRADTVLSERTCRAFRGRWPRARTPFADVNQLCPERGRPRTT